MSSRPPASGQHAPPPPPAVIKGVDGHSKVVVGASGSAGAELPHGGRDAPGGRSSAGPASTRSTSRRRAACGAATPGRSTPCCNCAPAASCCRSPTASRHAGTTAAGRLRTSPTGVPDGAVLGRRGGHLEHAPAVVAGTGARHLLSLQRGRAGRGGSRRRPRVDADPNANGALLRGVLRRRHPLVRPAAQPPALLRLAGRTGAPSRRAHRPALEQLPALPYAYGGRHVLHAAVSAEDGASWRGYREVYRDPRNAEPSSARGDHGTAYRFPVATADDRVLFASGQSSRRRALNVLDPAWLEADRQSDDFDGALEGWSVFGTSGLAVIDHPAGLDRRSHRPHRSLLRPLRRRG